MTVSSTTTKASYSGNGSTTVFAVPFYFLQNADLLVILRSSAGVETTQVLGTNYTLTGAGNENGGSLTMTVAPPTGTTLTILRNAAATQETDLLPNDRLPAESLETALDKLTMLVQQLDEENDRALKFAQTDSTASTTLPTAPNRANKFLSFDNNGNPIFVGATDTYTVSEEVKIATQGQTVFTLTTMSYIPGINNLSVFVDGVNQYRGTAYTETSSTSVTFSQGLHAGAIVKFSTVRTLTSDESGSDAIQFLQAGTGAVARSVQSKERDVVNILDFVPPGEQFAIINGTSTYDISNAIRYAIDSLGPNGGTVWFPNGGAAVVGSTVYIPPKGYGVTLQGNKFIITGGGVGTHSIFETGMPGNSFGGSSNWGQPNESVLNSGLIIRDFVFLECGTAIKVFNAIWRSEFSGNWAYQNVSTLLHAKRCFYSKTLNNTAIIGRSGRAASEPVYWFEEAVNVQTIVGNSASGNWGGVNKSGIGYLFTGGMAGLSFSNNSAESCVTGLKITSEVTGAEITGCYFELDTTAIDLGSAGKALDIGGCYFNSNVITAITSGGGWTSGTLKANNSIDPACLVALSAASNSCTVERPLNTNTLTTAYANYEIVPANWSLSSSIVVRRPTSTYDAAGGQNAQRALMSEQTNGAGLVALPYAGDLGAATGANPAFCSTTVGSTDVTVDTKIAYRPNGGAQFTAVIADNSATWKVAGAVRFGDTVYRLDATGITVVASDNSGYLRLVFGNFTAPISVSDIRVWIG